MAKLKDRKLYKKGILKFKMSVETIPGRHPNPWQGENAFDILIQNYNKITSLFPYQKQANNDDNWYTTYSSYDVRVKNDELFYPKCAEMKMNIYFTESISADEYFEKIRETVSDKVKITKLRTYAKLNEEQILKFLRKNKESFRYEIARNLKINSTTVRAALKRLVRKEKIEIIRIDKFQRRFYQLKQ